MSRRQNSRGSQLCSQARPFPYHKLLCLSGCSNQCKKSCVLFLLRPLPKKQKGRPESRPFTKCRYWTDLICLFLPLFGVSAYAAKSLFAHRINVAKIGMTIVRAEHVAVFNLTVNGCGLLQPFDRLHIVFHVLTDIYNRFSNLDGFTIASKQMLKGARTRLFSSGILRQIPNTFSETTVANRETEKLCRRPSHVCEFQLVSQMMSSTYLFRTQARMPSRQFGVC